MVRRSIIWTETAALQRREILKYWTLRNHADQYAKKLIGLIRNKTKMLASHPNSGVKTDFPEVQMTVMGHFSIFYKSSNEEIVIVAFWDNRQDPKRLLEIITKSKYLD